MTGTQRVWVLSGALTLLALALLGPRVGDPAPRELPLPMAWPAVALAFYVVETRVIHLHIGRSAHSFSMAEIPLLFGLFFLEPITFILARMLGGGLALVIARRQRSVKLAFNLSQFFLGSVVALAVVTVVAGGGVGFGPAEWSAAYLAILAENVLSVLAIALAISMAEGSWQLHRVPEMLRTGLMVSLANTSLALLAVVVIRYEPLAAVLFAVPVGVAAIAYRAYVMQRQQKEGLEMLYESTRILQRSPQVDGAIVELLRHARTMFRADVAELTLLPAREGEELLRSVVRGDAPAEAMAPMGTTLDDPLLRRALDARAPVLVAASDPAHSPRFRNAMVAPLVGERRVLGLLVVADRLSDISTFDTGDLRLFETLANHIGVSLENGQLEQSLHRLAELKDELHHQANHDSLTGLANRELFGKAVAARLEAAEPGGRVLALLFLDLDDFKLVNDTLGHPVGDELLRMVGDRIARIVRGEDVAARLGGDEFAVLLWDREDLAGARRLAERLRIALDDVFHIGSSVVSIHASVGLAAAASPSIPAEELMRNADVAMYVAKANGKGRLVVFEPSMAAELVHRSRTSTDLRSAIVGGQLVLHYQPVFDIGSDRVVGAEALVRWNHPQRGLVGPLEFIELAEQSSLIIDLGAWVIHTAAAQLRAWADLGEPYDSWWMSVNVSPRQLERPEFVDEIARALEVAGVTPDRLALEMTESALIPSVDASVDRLHRLRRLGVMLMIDDFGTGYSSLGYLQRFPVGTLKIAREFVDVDAAKPGAWGLAAAVIAMSETLGLDVIAEGVETEEQLERLRDLGCRHAQGFLLARPAPATDIERRFGPPAEVAPPSMGYAPTHRPVLPTR